MNLNLTRRQRRVRAIENQIRRLDRCLGSTRRQSDQWTRLRLVSFTLLLVLGAVIFLSWGALTWAITLIILAIPFIYTVWQHRQVENRMTRFAIWKELKQEQLARMVLDWPRIPSRFQFPIAPDHPFAFDLDLIGERSVLRLLDRSITKEGSGRLQEWLLAEEPNPAATLERQNLVRELIQLPSFSDRLALQAQLAGKEGEPRMSSRESSETQSQKQAAQWSGRRLLLWLEAKSNTGSLRPVLIIMFILAFINWALLGLNLGGFIPPLWLGSWVIYAVVALSQSRKVEPMFRDAAFLGDNLRRLSGVLGYLEERPFARQPALESLCAPLRASGKRPSEQLRRANRLFAAAGLRYNPGLALLLNAFVPWDIFFAYRLDKFKVRMASLVPAWLDLLATLEALNGLAGIGNLYPQSSFPDFLPLPSEKEAFSQGCLDESPFVAREMAHPLIAPENCIPNDFTVEKFGSIAMITGSNMAGKSSFLRTLGVNICLANSGAPVLARELHLVPWRVIASITITDSVTDGFSFFYAEVRRLKLLLDELQRVSPYPLFFLIDEIFRGTNNRERLIGGRSFVRNLVGHYGAGAIATHDLELVKLSEDLPEISNYHFRDSVIDGRMVFDYLIHPGPCPTTNALKIMRLAGLPVEIDGDSG